MKICIDARSPGYAGVLNYASCLLRGFASLDRGLELLVLRAPQDRPWGMDGVEERVLPAGHFPSWLLWSNTSPPLEGRFRPLPSFHSARFLIHPEHYRWYDARYWKVMSPLAVRHYDAVIAVSEAEKRNYVERMGAPPTKVHVIQLASDERFRVVDDPKRFEQVRIRYGLPQRFVLYVGRQVPVKNLDTVLRGYRAARDAGVREHGLVLVGRETWHTPLRKLAEELGIAEHVRLVGPVFDELPEVYNLADLFLLMSHYEAFPAVPLEAMACGTPVVTSDRGGLPEVVGDAGVTLPALDAGRLGEAIHRTLGSEEVRGALREKGLRRVGLFSWRRCAERTVDLYEEVLGA